MKTEPEEEVLNDHLITSAEDIEYAASLLKQLKMIVDQSGHRMLYHLINMAEMEANSIIQDEKSQEPPNQPND
jgi:hypothetical protein